VNRRRFLASAGALGVFADAMHGTARPAEPSVNLLTAPIEVTGAWPGSLPGSAAQVVTRMRAVCLAGVRLLSDRQPQKLRVDDHVSGPPYVWLHRDQPTTAWVIVDIGPRDWCKLAYQFGHELGHVLCNSWGWGAQPRLPTQWLEESMVEAFSLRGLGRLADSWQRDPPFAGDGAFAGAIRQYRQNQIEQYRRDPRPNLDAAAWFRETRADLEAGKLKWGGPAILGILALYEADARSVEDLGAVNRWPGRSGIPIEDYLARWQTSCAEVGAPGRLPSRVRRLFHLG
jgi:hypothetical protein